MSSSGHDNKNFVVPKEDVQRFIRDCMKKSGVNEKDADTVAHHLMTSDYRGHFSHGLNRLEFYVDDIVQNIVDPTAQPKIVQDFQV